MTEIEKKTGMTDAECEYWDNYVSTHPFEPGPNLLAQGIKPGTAHNSLFLNVQDKSVINYLETLSKKSNQTPSQVATSLIQKEMAYA
jgi:hypothetical protein